MTEELKKILKSIQGRVVAFGFKTNKFESVLKTNKKITHFDIFDEISKKQSKEKQKQAKIGINKLRKKYKKKNIDVIIISVDEIKKHIIHLLKETIYIGKKDLYLYGNKELVMETLNKYKRYQITYDIKEYNDNFIVKINIENAKNNKFKDNFYLFLDKIKLLFEFITDLLTS